jgi:hypothetical protein
MPKLPNPPEADYLFIFLKSAERSETIILGILDNFFLRTHGWSKNHLKYKKSERRYS